MPAKHATWPLAAILPLTITLLGRKSTGRMPPGDMTRAVLRHRRRCMPIVLALVLFGLPNLFRKPPPKDMPFAVRLVTIAPDTRATTPNLFRPRPEAKPEPPRANPRRSRNRSRRRRRRARLRLPLPPQCPRRPAAPRSDTGPAGSAALAIFRNRGLKPKRSRCRLRRRPHAPAKAGRGARPGRPAAGSGTQAEAGTGAAPDNARPRRSKARAEAGDPPGVPQSRSRGVQQAAPGSRYE